MSRILRGIGGKGPERIVSAARLLVNRGRRDYPWWCGADSGQPRHKTMTRRRDGATGTGRGQMGRAGTVVAGAALAVVLAVGGWFWVARDGAGQAAAQGEGGLTQEGLVAARAARLAVLTSTLEQAAPEAKPALLQEMAILRADLADPAAALAAAQAQRGRIEALRDLYRGTPAEAQIAAALAALAAGDRAGAEAAMAEVRVLAEGEAARAARVAYAAGDMAAARGAWTEAARAYVRAAALDPTYPHLLAAERQARIAGDIATATAYAMPLLSAAVRQFGQGSAPHGEALSAVGQTMFAAGRAADAEKLLREAVAVSRGPNGARDAEYAKRLNNLGAVLRGSGRVAEAEALYREAVEVDRQVLGETHPDVALRLANLAELLVATGRPAEAEPLLRQAAGIALGLLGDAHPDTAARLGALAAFLEAQGEAEAAGAAWVDALAVSRRAYGPAHPEHVQRLALFADRLRATGRGAEAEAVYREVIEGLAASPGKASADYGRALNNLGQFLVAADRRDEAVPLFQEAVGVLTTALGAEDAQVRTVEANLAAAQGG
ncbi:MAG: tetratricopeptide repeat protein [Gemmobacter sp.]